MEYLQYYRKNDRWLKGVYRVLNLIINGIPSILSQKEVEDLLGHRFKPYYKWNTFNTELENAALVGSNFRF